MKQIKLIRVKFSLTFFLMLGILMSCSNRNISSNQRKYGTNENMTKDSISGMTKDSSNAGTSTSTSLDSRKMVQSKFECIDHLNISFGAIQSDSAFTGQIFPIGKCIQGQNSFDVIWFNAQLGDWEKGKQNFTKEFKNGLEVKGFSAIIFCVKMEEVSDPLLDDPYSFPAMVSVYKILDSEWIEIESKLIINFENYAQLQQNIITKELNLHLQS